MHPRRPPGRTIDRPRARLSRGALVAAVALGLAAGCSSTATPAKSPAPSGNAGGSTGRPCGTARTAANVPVKIEVAQGKVSCGTAMAIEHQYAHAIRSGQAPGNGGGGPVKVKGWTCEGFPTPTVLKTGKTSKCVQDGNEILEVLPT
jgi:hypothetical protein